MTKYQDPFGSFMPPAQDPFGGFSNPFDARGLNPLVQQRMEQQMYDRIEAYRRESEALEEAPLGSDLTPDPPPDIVDAAGNPMPWSE